MSSFTKRLAVLFAMASLPTTAFGFFKSPEASAAEPENRASGPGSPNAVTGGKESAEKATGPARAPITNSIGMKLVFIPCGEFMMVSGESALELEKAFGPRGESADQGDTDEPSEQTIPTWGPVSRSDIQRVRIGMSIETVIKMFGHSLNEGPWIFYPAKEGGSYRVVFGDPNASRVTAVLRSSTMPPDLMEAVFMIPARLRGLTVEQYVLSEAGKAESGQVESAPERNSSADVCAHGPPIGRPRLLGLMHRFRGARACRARPFRYR